MKILTNIVESTLVKPSTTAQLDVFDSVEALPHYALPKKNELLLSIVCIRGSVTLNFDMHSMVIGEKSLAMILPGHYIESYKVSDDFQGFMITSAKRNLESFLPLMSRMMICSLQFKENPAVRLTDEELSNQIMLHDLLSNKLRLGNTIFDKIVMDKIVEAVFCETVNIYFKRLDKRMTALCNRSEALFYHFIINVEKHFKEERSVSFYANQLCVTSKHLSAVVKDLSGRTAGEWIDSYVIAEMKHMLSTTDMTIQEISTEMHFANQSFFGKYFKAHVGMSPREYRSRVFADESCLS